MVIKNLNIVMDKTILVMSFLIALYGFFIFYSSVDGNQALIFRQGVKLFIAFSSFFLISQVSPTYFRIFTPWIFGFSISLLIIVMFSGMVGQGAQRWLDFGILTIQPSELLKFVVPMMIAWYMHEKNLPPNFNQVLGIIFIIIIPSALIMVQPDLGTAVLVFIAGAFTLFLTGVSKKFIFMLASMLIGCAPVLWYFMQDYQRARVLTFLSPGSDPLGSGYNIIQSKIALGSGGLFGKGWLNGSQSHLEFLPERSTDFIFAVAGEEFGFLGLLSLLFMYLILVGRCVWISSQASGTFNRLLSGALSLTFFFYVFINAGMVCGILPVVGVTLPLISTGGTSMLALMITLGMIVSIHKHKNLLR